MPTKTTSKAAFAAAVEKAVQKFGGRTSKVTDYLMLHTFRRTADASREDGIHSIVRNGIQKGVAKHLKGGTTAAGAEQMILPGLMPYVERLTSHSLYVPDGTGQGEYRHVTSLLQGPESLSDLLSARDFHRLKAHEATEESSRIDALYRAACTAFGAMAAE